MSKIVDLLKSYTYQKKWVLEKLICHRLDMTKTELFAKSETDISESDQSRIDMAYTSYISDHKPLEYILWYVSFADLKFQVNKNTLIPRPETEYMIDAVREYIAEISILPTKKQNTITLLDIWTWCGVLGTSILHHCWAHVQQAILADLSKDALKVASTNYTTIIWNTRNWQDKLVISNLIDHQDIHTILKQENDTIIVANLPYIPDELFDKNADPTVHNREPRMAFIWGDDGLDLYRVMFGQLKIIYPLIRGYTEGFASKKVIFYLEMMTRQVDILRKEYTDRVFEEIKTFHFNIRIVRVIV